MKSSGRPAYGLRTHQGYWRFLMLRHSVSRDQWMVNLITAAEDRAAVEPIARGLMRRHPQVVSVVNNITARKASVAAGEREVHLAGAGGIVDRVGSFDFEISANSFFQTNTRGAHRLYRTVREFARLSGRETLLDLYCGTGTIAIFLSKAARSVVGIDITPSAIRDAEANRRRNGVDNCEFRLGDIRDELARLAAAPDVLVIDPPRDGMHKDGVRQVLEMAPERIVYVSCNPATLARDLALLQPRYRAVEAQPVDLFPHTWHIETVVRLERALGGCGSTRIRPKGEAQADGKSAATSAGCEHFPEARDPPPSFERREVQLPLRPTARMTKRWKSSTRWRERSISASGAVYPQPPMG
jgi:23S rRNA (uracil1939-C5)-methyltransferase